MQVVSSYGAEIKNKNIPIRHTLALYREAVRCLTEIYETVWTELSMIDQIKRRFNEAEHPEIAAPCGTCGWTCVHSADTGSGSRSNHVKCRSWLGHLSRNLLRNLRDDRSRSGLGIHLW